MLVMSAASRMALALIRGYGKANIMSVTVRGSAEETVHMGGISRVGEAWPNVAKALHSRPTSHSSLVRSTAVSLEGDKVRT